MEMIGHNKDNARGLIIPPGFTVVPSGRNDLIIHHLRGGMGCMNVFLIVWLVGWSFACVFLLRQYLHGGKMDDGSPIPLWFVCIFWTGEVVVACLLSYLLFCKKSFRTHDDSLGVDTVVLCFRTSRTIPKNGIKRFVQVKDGGEGDDSFPSWGLKVEADKKATLLFRQPYEKSHWLGQVLAKWAGVDFIEALRE